MWFMEAEKVPFNDSVKVATEFVLNEAARPKIPKETNPEMAGLIRDCWKVDVTLSLGEILARLRSMQ